MEGSIKLSTLPLATSFLIFVLLVAKPITRAVIGAVDNRCKRIKDELDRAVELREEAQAILADYKRKQQEALKEAENIVVQAEVLAKRLLEEARTDLEEALNRRVEIGMQKISMFQSSVLKEVQGQTVDLAIRAVTSILKEDLAKGSVDSLIEPSIVEIDQKFH